jgi:hypothetical protein
MRTPTILDVHPSPEVLRWEWEQLEEMDIHVVGCRGPEASGGCPLLRGEECALLDGADGVMFHLDLDKPEHRRLLTKYVALADRHEVPVRVVVSEEQQARWAPLLSLAEVFTAPVGAAKLDAFASEVEGGWGKAD